MRDRKRKEETQEQYASVGQENCQTCLSSPTQEPHLSFQQIGDSPLASKHDYPQVPLSQILPYF